MIFGKTPEVRRAALERLNEEKRLGLRHFAWRPIKIKDGRIIWLRFYFAYYFHDSVWTRSLGDERTRYVAYLDKKRVPEHQQEDA